VIPAPRLRPERVDRSRLFLRTNRFRAAFALGPPSFLLFNFLQITVFAEGVNLDGMRRLVSSG
jgi:hypothetical protein